MNTKMTLEKRILSVLLTVIMVFSMVPLSVFAADSNQASVTVNKTETEYATIQEAFDAAKKLTDPCTVKVLQNFKGSMVLGVTFTAEDNCDITLDVNGFDMYNRNTRDQASASMFTFEKGTNAHLTVVNNSENRDTYGGIFYYPNGTDISNSVFHMEGGTLTIEDVGGDGIKNKTSNYDKISGSIVYLDGGNVTINGSKFGEDNNIVPLYVKSGNLTVNGGEFISQQGNALRIAEGFDGDVKLSGGKFSSTFTSSKMDEKGNFVQVYSISSILREDGGKVDDLLAKGYVYQKNAEDEKNSESALYREISIVPEPGVKYIAADGTEQSCTDYTELTDASTGALTGWYAVNGTVNIDGAIGVSGTLNLILCDGATLNLQNTLYMLGNSTLNIYAQSGGTGTLIAKATTGQAAIGLMSGTSAKNATVNIYGGTVTAQAESGAQPIGINPSIMKGTVNVTIAKGMKCVKTNDQNTAYAYDNTDGTSITITKCTKHKWSYTNMTDDTHDQTCDLCGTTETAAHSPARYQGTPNKHHIFCACGKDYATERHSFAFTPNDDGLTHEVSCAKCGEVTNKAETHSFSDRIESEGRTWFACECGAIHSATYDGKNYASLQSAIDAAAPVGGTVTLAPTALDENVVVTDGTVTIDLSGKRWIGNIGDDESYVPLTVNGGSVTLKNGNLFQWWSSSSARTGIKINGGSLTVGEDVSVMGGVPDRDVLCPSITLNDGSLILKEGAALLSGLTVPEDKVLADYLPEGTAFVKCSYDRDSDTVTVSDPQEFVPDVYTTNKSTEGMAVVSHTHDFSENENACACGFNCDHSAVDEATGKCGTCGTQVYVAYLTKSNGEKTNFDSFEDAFWEAQKAKGAVLTMLCDVDLGSKETPLSINFGNFTLDLGGFTLKGSPADKLLTVNGGTAITIKNGKLHNTYYSSGDGHPVLKTTANAIEQIGGSVTLQGVTLQGGTGNDRIQSNAIVLYGGSLTVNDATLLGGISMFCVSENARPTLQITKATLSGSFQYGYSGKDKDYSAVNGFLKPGSMFFSKDGKYIDIQNDSYWQTDGDDETGYYSTLFTLDSDVTVKPHEHTFSDGICSECDYACPHDSGKNDREASYFEKAICSICHSEYGDYAKDTTAPTGEIKIKERTWWQSLLNTISFGLFYKEEVTVEITATDDSYEQPGYDETKHAVKIEYLISNTAMSEEAVKDSTFTEYTEPFALSDDDQYVIYAKLTDCAGNVAYACSEGFEIDKTAPLIEGMENYGVYHFCAEKTITVTDKNIDKATMDGTEISLDENGQYTLPVDSEKHKIVVADKAGNETTVWITVYPSHDFDKTTDKCINCGTLAAAKVENGDISDRFATGDELFKALVDEKYNGATVTLLTDLAFTENVSPSGDAPVRNDLTIDLNGKTLQGSENGALVVFGGAVRIWSSNGEGTLTTNLCVFGANASLTMDSGIGEVERVMFRLGNLTIHSGRYALLNVICEEENTADLITLYGGSYNTIHFATDCPATAEQILGKGYRYDGVDYSAVQGEKSLSKVSVIPCDHSDLSNFVCTGCGMEIFLSAEKNGEATLFGTFEDAIRYAEQNEGCTVKLLRDLLLDTATVGDLRENTYGYVELTKGTYTLDLAGKTLTAGDWNNYYAAIKICDGCDLTITDSVGGGKVVSEINTILNIRSGSHLTIEGGDYSAFGGVNAEGPDSLTLKGGRFKQVYSVGARNSVSPLRYLADGYAFVLTDSGAYAGEKDVKSQVISGKGTAYWIDKVTVVLAPVYISAGLQPQDKAFYLTSPDANKRMSAWVVCRDLDTDKKITLTLEKTDGTAIMSNERDYAKNGIISEALDLKALAESSELYRVKIEFDGYALYSNTFRITVAVCEHPGYDEDNKCTQCECDLAAAVIKDGKTTGYVNFADALAAAQTDENKGCTLRLLADVSGTVGVDTGEFAIEINGKSIIGNLQVKKAAKVNISGGTVTETVTVAKAAQLTASNTLFAGAINCVGGGNFKDCIFMGAVSAKGSSFKLNSCEIHGGTLSVSGSAEAEECTVSGTVTVNNGGSFKSTGGTYGNTVNAKSGGTLEIISGTFDKKLTAEAGSKLIISGGSYAEVATENDVDFTIRGGEFTNVTVNGQFLIDCLAEGKALKDMNNGEIIDGRVGIAGPVQVVDHTHTCIWKTNTHEKLCGCGYVEAVDTEAPVISGVENGKTYYGGVEFSVTDANEFTVTVDGKVVQLTLGSYILEPDNEQHTITATDAAGNTASVTINVFCLYKVTLSNGKGYKITGEPLAGYGTDYTFTVEIAEGYSKTADFMVDVNGRPMQSDTGSYTISPVTSDIVITVFGVADITPPDVEINIRGNIFKEFLNRINFGPFFKQMQTVQVTAEDEGSGVDRVEYLLSETPFTDKDAITGNWTELTLNDDREAYFNIMPNQKAFIYVRVTDKSGNITVVNTDGVVVYTDAEAITGAQTYTMDSDRDVLYELKLNGNALLAVYNGTEEIRSVTDYSLIENGANAVLTLKNKYLRTLAAGEYTFRLTFNPMGEAYADNAGNDAPAEVVFKLTVEKKTPTLGHKESDVKIYDGNPIGKPTVNTDSDGTVTFEYKKLGEDDAAYTTEAPENVGKYVIRITTAETDTFKAASSTMKFEIQPKDVTISDTLVSDKEYNGNTDASITSVGTVKGLAYGDDVTIAVGKATFADKNVGANKTVTFSDFSLSGSDASNYTLVSQPSAVTASITVKEIAINGAEVESTKVYDGTTTATITNIGSPSENFDGDDLTVIPGTAAYADKNVGNGKTVTFSGFTLSGEAAANYTVISQPADTMADITAKEVTIVGVQVEQTKVYDGTTAATVTNAGAPSVNYDGESLKVTAGKAAYDNKNVGTDKAVTFSDFALAGDAASNYKLTEQPTSVTANITVREIKIVDTAVEASKIYDGATDAKVTEKGALDVLVKGDEVTIVTGKANYSDKNVGTDKAVVFTDFALTGNDAANYKLSAQPTGTAASITPKKLTIADLKIKDKQYDGKNTAEIDGTPTLVGLVDGDALELINGTPTFDDVMIGKDIPISFTKFTLSGDTVTVGNYTLKQPTGITANIVEYIADGSEYTVNSNDWINTDFVITAKDGYKLGLTDMTGGEWTDKLIVSNETANGKLTFYVKNTATGTISAAVTENYKIDKTAPTGELELNERPYFQTALNKIDFDLFFNNAVNVELTAHDDASGIKSVMYFKAERILSEDEVRAVTDWNEDSNFNIKTDDNTKFIIYVRIEDNAGNITYIGSNGVTFDTTAPEISGVKDGETYYVTKKVKSNDKNPESVTLNGNTVDEEFILDGNTDAIYVIRATDKAGNVTEYTVNMKPISSLTDDIAKITVDNVKSSSSETVNAVEKRLMGIDVSGATNAELDELQKASAKCKKLLKRLSDVAAEITRITDSVNGYSIETVNSNDKADIQKLISDIDSLLDGDNLTASERNTLEDLKATAKTLLDRIKDAKEAAESSDITKVKGITKDNVKLEDKENLEKAKDALEKALETFGGNYTDKENNRLETQLKIVKDALSAIGNAEKAADEIKKLPNPKDVRLSDKDKIIRIKETVDSLTENEKTMLGKDAINLVNELVDRITELERISFAPSIIEGAGQKWNSNSNKNALFRSNAEFDEFIKVLVDGKKLDSSNYNAYADNSTVIELKADYLNTLSAGEHTLGIVSQNGTAATIFTVVKDKDDDNHSPRTGTANTLPLWIALLFVSGGVFTGVTVASKKKRRFIK